MGWCTRTGITPAILQVMSETSNVSMIFAPLNVASRSRQRSNSTSFNDAS